MGVVIELLGPTDLVYISFFTRGTHFASEPTEGTTGSPLRPAPLGSATGRRVVVVVDNAAAIQTAARL